MVERYKYFVEHSERGTDCSYARKCRDLYLKYDHKDICDKLEQVIAAIRIIEGPDFGKDNNNG